MVIIDYGMGNVASILNMLKKVGVAATVSADPEVVSRAHRLILPGVGSFDAGMRNLTERGLVPVLTRKVILEKTPILQVLSQFDESEKTLDDGKQLILFN